MKLLRLNKICLNKMYSKILIGKYLSDSFPIQIGLKQGYALWPLPTLLGPLERPNLSYWTTHISITV
jgi:hypothetical protein